MENVLKKRMVCEPLSCRTSFASSGTVQPARAPVPPTSMPIAMGREMCLTQIHPFDAAATEKISSMIIVMTAVLRFNQDVDNLDKLGGGFGGLVVLVGLGVVRVLKPLLCLLILAFDGLHGFQVAAPVGVVCEC